MKKLLLILLLLSVFIYCSCYEKHNNKNNNLLNEQILKNIKTKDIILFGECEHNRRIYKQTFLNFLRAYIKNALNDSTLSRKIAIVLEAPHSFESMLNNYFKTGNAYYLINSPLSFPSNDLANWNLPDVEFYFDLKQIKDSISMNNRTLKDSFDIKLIFPEEDLPPDMRPNERQEYFAKKRDIYTCNYLMNKIDSLHGYKFIGLYGIFHIDKRDDPKTPIPKLARLLIKNGIKFVYGCTDLVSGE